MHNSILYEDEKIEGSREGARTGSSFPRSYED